MGSCNFSHPWKNVAGIGVPSIVVSGFGWLSWVLSLVLNQARKQIVILVFLLVFYQNIYSVLRVKVANFPSLGFS